MIESRTVDPLSISYLLYNSVCKECVCLLLHYAIMRTQNDIHFYFENLLCFFIMMFYELCNKSDLFQIMFMSVLPVMFHRIYCTKLKQINIEHIHDLAKKAFDNQHNYNHIML